MEEEGRLSTYNLHQKMVVHSGNSELKRKRREIAHRDLARGRKKRKKKRIMEEED